MTQPTPAARSSRLQDTGTGAPVPAAPSVGAAQVGAGPKVLRAAWLSILLGVLIEALLLGAAAFGGKALHLGPLFAELAQKVTWSVLVCVGIAFGTAAAKARSPMMGLLGLASAPIAFNVARAVHKGMSHALSAAAAMAPGPSPILLALLKAVEYGLLGSAIGWIGRRRGTGLAAYAGTGLGVGLTVGLLTVLLLGHADLAPAPASTVVARGINEMLFPVGCSLVLFAADRVSKHLAG